MLELTETVTRHVVAPPLAPSDRPIDLDHLSRMTLGDRALEREVLGLFRQQEAVLRARLRSSAPDVAGVTAHTLKGSATGIGAWAVARAAAQVEQAAGSRNLPQLQIALTALDQALRAAVAEIDEILQADIVGANRRPA